MDLTPDLIEKLLATPFLLLVGYGMWLNHKKRMKLYDITGKVKKSDEI